MTRPLTIHLTGSAGRVGGAVSAFGIAPGVSTDTWTIKRVCPIAAQGSDVARAARVAAPG
jgi:hypothetical protein